MDLKRVKLVYRWLLNNGLIKISHDVERQYSYFSNELKTLMSNRMVWSVESVRAMNIIDIVFADDESVRKAWNEYYQRLCVEQPTETQLKQIQQTQDKMLETMAISLGYKGKITWETIQNPYIPKGMVAAIDQQQIIQKGQAELAKVADTFTQLINTNAANQAPRQQEDIPHANT